MQTYHDRSYIQGELNRFTTQWRKKIDDYRASSRANFEISETQTFWNSLLSCFGIQPGTVAEFELPARRASTNHHGRIDMFWPSTLLVEQKTLGKNLEDAITQAQDYIDGGSIPEENLPRYVMVSDFERFILVNRRSGEREEFALEQLPDRYDSLKFLVGEEAISAQEQQELTIAASKIMARLYQAMLGDEADTPIGEAGAVNAEDEDIRVLETSMFLTRVLFLLFGDDAGIWERHLFARFLRKHTREDGSDLGTQINALFEYLDTPDAKRSRMKNVPELMERFPYVNGSLFAERTPTEYFTRELREELLVACGFDWSQISTAIFGSMFQLVKSRKARRAAGEHYTTEENILKTIGPLFLDDFTARVEAVLSSNDSDKKKRFALAAILQELSETHFFDPACGSGNFLQVAYMRLRALETHILVEMRRLSKFNGDMALDASWSTSLSIAQFHGIELNWWPSKIAEVAMFLSEFQADRDMARALGQVPTRLPITSVAHIVHADALKTDWRELIPSNAKRVFIFGNPPFLGQWTKSKEQTTVMKAVWGKHYNGYLDFVTAWFWKSALFFKDTFEGEFAFVSTNSITQGQPVPALFEPLFEEEKWKIKFAYRTFPWDSQAPGQAAVHCVIIGFTRSAKFTRRLFEYNWTEKTTEEIPVVKEINAYLLDAPNLLIKKRSKPLSSQLPVVNFGSKPVDNGNLIIEVNEYEQVMKDPIAALYVRPFRMGKELVRGLDRWCLWLEDANPAHIAKSPILKSRVEANRLWRSQQTPTGDAYKLRDIPHLMRPNKNRPLEAYVGIPAVVSETRPFYTVAHLSADVIAGNQIYTASDPDGFIFAVISSSMFITWQRAIGGALESRLRFSNTLVWNNLPLPPVDETLRSKIIEAGKKILTVREALAAKHGGLVSLADLYNPLAMSPELLTVHRELDSLVDKAFGASRRCSSNIKRLEVLFARYAELTNTKKS